MGLWSRWVARMDTRELPHALAALRIALGVAALWAVVINAGVADVVWIDADYGGYRKLGEGPWLTAWLGGPTPAVVHGLLGSSLAGALMLLLGLLPGAGALLCQQSLLALDGINGHSGGSYDQLLSNALWLMVFARSGATASLECRLKTGKWVADSGVRVPAWPRYLMILQLVILYTSTGTQKLSAHWLPGGDLGALYYILLQPSWGRFSDMTWLAWIFPVTQVMTLGVWTFEVSSVLLLVAMWGRASRTTAGPVRQTLSRLRYRDLFVLFGLGMHIGIHVLMEVGPFSAISLAMYTALFSGEEWARLGARWRQRSAARASPPGRTPHPAG